MLPEMKARQVAHVQSGRASEGVSPPGGEGPSQSETLSLAQRSPRGPPEAQQRGHLRGAGRFPGWDGRAGNFAVVEIQYFSEIGPVAKVAIASINAIYPCS